MVLCESYHRGPASKGERAPVFNPERDAPAQPIGRIIPGMSMRFLVPAIVAVLGLTPAAQAPRGTTHTLIPNRFHNTFSFAHEPVLRLTPGDRVVTKTIDAGGVDWNGKAVAVGPNPQTGPFYIEGAEPGDMLVVRVETIDTNRATGFSSSLPAPYAVDPGAIASRVDRDPRRATWVIDKARGIARLDAPDITPLPIELPLRPMLGCLGVAPARKEAIATSTPGTFGGNMDYAGLIAGVTVMLPVSEPGALLFLGDGHARQGEGEIVGTGIETSMDVEFSVDLVKKKTIGWPRLENDTYIMVLGSARPLLQALQHATSEMQRWLVADYSLNERGAAVLMGQALEYEIANVVDPNFTIVAKMRKTMIPRRP
jgi:acetamidase/formamidase